MFLPNEAGGVVNTDPNLAKTGDKTVLSKVILSLL